MKLEKKYIIAGLIGLLTITGAFAYLQYKKLMNYKISFKSFKVLTLSLKKVSLNVFLNFENLSSIGFDIESQEYNVIMNGKSVSQITNYAKNKIEPKSTSVIGVNVMFNPEQVAKVLGKDYAIILLNAKEYKVDIEMKLKVKLYGITINIPYTYSTTLMEFIKPS